MTELVALDSMVACGTRLVPSDSLVARGTRLVAVDPLVACAIWLDTSVTAVAEWPELAAPFGL